MGVAREDVLRVAALARLRLDPDEVEITTAQLARIIEHVDALAEVEAEAGAGEDAEGEVRPGMATSTPVRPDEPGADPLAYPPQEMAPEWREGMFTVPRLGSHDGGAGADE